VYKSYTPLEKNSNIKTFEDTKEYGGRCLYYITLN
jgi:hypothetical protein